MPRAGPRVVAAPSKVSDCMGDMTMKSRAAGQPPDQLGKSMSARQFQVPGIREHQFLGGKADE